MTESAKMKSLINSLVATISDNAWKLPCKASEKYYHRTHIPAQIADKSSFRLTGDRWFTPSLEIAETHARDEREGLVGTLFEITFKSDILVAQLAVANAKQLSRDGSPISSWGKALELYSLDGGGFANEYECIRKVFQQKFGSEDAKAGLWKEFTNEVLLLNCERSIATSKCIEGFLT